MNRAPYRKKNIDQIPGFEGKGAFISHSQIKGGKRIRNTSHMKSAKERNTNNITGASSQNNYNDFANNDIVTATMKIRKR